MTENAEELLLWLENSRPTPCPGEIDAMWGVLEDLKTAEARAEAAEAREEEAWKKVDQLMADRKVILSVDTTDGLTSSEWILRTGKALARAKAAEAEVERLRKALEGKK